MTQNILVALLVAGCFVYVLWSLAPKAPRSRIATSLLKLPLPRLLQKPLLAAVRQQGGCGCNGCDRSVASKNRAAKGSSDIEVKPGFQPVTFVRGKYAKKLSP
jgi:hypothetical protein